MSDREFLIWIGCGLILHCATFFTVGYVIGVNR